MKRDGLTGRGIEPAPTKRLEKAVCQTLSRVFAICDELADVVTTDLADRSDAGLIKLQELKSLYASARRTLTAPDSPIYGLGFAVDPKAFAEPGLLWWYSAPAGQELRPLAVSMQPGHLTYYDYTVSHWWRGSLGDEKPHLFGPYVDHSGTNAYIVTFSRGVFLHDVQIGMIVGDILVGTLQSLWQRELSALPKPSSLVDEDGVVVATNSARLLGSALRASSNSAKLAMDGINWKIVVEDSGPSQPTRKKVA